jgi:molybdopterin-guanine dinucleotide biosynthesis protein A
MGRPKAMLKIGGTTLIERTVGELLGAFDDVVVVAAPATEGIELPAVGPAAIVRDSQAYRGPAEALARGLRAARHDVAFVCSCDLPMLRAEVAGRLIALLDDFDAVIPRIGDRLQLLHAVYRRRCADALDAMSARDERRLGALVEAINARIVPETDYRRADPEALSCFNINTPEDYARAARIQRSARR